MAVSISPVRYAQAIMQIALEQDMTEAWASDLDVLVGALKEADLEGFLDAPQVQMSVKMDLIEDLFGKSVSPLALKLISLLATKSLTSILPEVQERFSRLVDVHEGTEMAYVTSAVPLNSESENEIAKILGALTGKNIRLEVRVDPDIFGGFIVRAGDHMIDGSLRSKLKEMRRKVVSRNV